MDAFFASVEIRDRPELQTKPVVIGGSPEGRGVIAAANYTARRYGIHSAMPSYRAKKLCPDLIFLPLNFEKYRTESRAIHEIFHRYTDLIEPLSLDEAYLDVSEQPHCGGSATLMAQEIRQKIYLERGLCASAGIAPNKFLAKVASDWNKPNGQFVITPEQIPGFIQDLPVRKIFGVGKRTAEKLEKLDVYTCGELQALSVLDLQHYFGSRGYQLYEMARGIDERPVITSRQRKSVSTEHTFNSDLHDLESAVSAVSELQKELLTRYEKISKQYAVKSLFVKLRFSDFTISTVESHLKTEASLENFMELLKEGFARKDLSVRLIGLGFRLNPLDEVQLTFWPPSGFEDRRTF